MPDLDLKITGVKSGALGLTPLLNFELEVTNPVEGETIHSVALQAQIQISALQRSYTAVEKEKLVDLFGTPDRWGQTLSSRLWTIAGTTVRGFTGKTTTVLPVQCTFDLNVIAAKYFYALDAGEVPLLFLFSGTIFYAGPDGRLQVQQISWNKESAFRIPVAQWKELMNDHYPNTAWLYLHRDVFDRLYAYRRAHGIATWEETIERLLLSQESAPAPEAIAGIPAATIP
jgi:Family of unknown function (DUF6084)